MTLNDGGDLTDAAVLVSNGGTLDISANTTITNLSVDDIGGATAIIGDGTSHGVGGTAFDDSVTITGINEGTVNAVSFLDFVSVNTSTGATTASASRMQVLFPDL